ncbi:MAG TPA: GHMP kinase [Kiritimatiellia bacterium]|nr:GHMP kinase [Kiritimatiellia bacterium]HRZ13244.1 GHMP kinase [Kiritimatiellia bacterium]HSA18693.1 GHMP kinase [Kiritimatiellia bacterium]
MNPYLRAKSPLRLSFAGGGSDIEAVYKEIGGAVLVATINKYSYVSIRPHEDDRIRIRSLDFNVEVDYAARGEPPYDGVLDLAKACVEETGIRRGLDISLQTEAPPGSGLGSSSSMITALLAGLQVLTGRHMDPYELAEKAYDVERVKMKISGGKQDQYACSFGGFNLIEFHPDNVEVTPLRLRPDILNDVESHCMLCFTGRTRLSANLIDKQVAAFHEAGSSSRAGTEKLKALAYEAKNLLLRGKISEFGHLLHEAHLAKKTMNPLVTDEFIDSLYEEARRLGAFGGKILGAGGGGYLMLFAPIDNKQAIREKLEQLGGRFATFGFCPDGVQTWTSACP